jgi:hypothetical protein
MAAGSAHSISFAIYSLVRETREICSSGLNHPAARVFRTLGLLLLHDVKEYDPLLGSSVAADVEEGDTNILFSASGPAGSPP